MLTQQRQQQHRLMTHSNQLRTQVVVSISLSLSHTDTTYVRLYATVYGEEEKWETKNEKRRH